MRPVKVQKIWQADSKIIGFTNDGQPIIEGEASTEPNGQPIGIDDEGRMLYPFANETLAQDSTTIDEFESLVLRRANTLNLFDPIAAQELERKALANALDDTTKMRIKDLQEALKIDGKYTGPIDGIPGERTRQGLSSLVLENAPALIDDSEKLEADQEQENIKSIGRGR